MATKAYHAADSSERIVDDVRQFDLESKHEHADKDGKDVDVGQYGFPRKPRPQSSRRKCVQEKEHLDNDEAAGEITHCGPKMDITSGMMRLPNCVNRGSVFERIELKHSFESLPSAISRMWNTTAKATESFNPSTMSGVFSFGRRDHHRRADEVERDDGERAAVFEFRSLNFTNAMPIRTIRVSSVILPARSRAVSKLIRI